MDFKKSFLVKPVFGMIHCGSQQGMTVMELARQEIEIYLRNDIYPLIENYFGSDEDCERVLEWISEAHPDAIYGVNILGDYHKAFELAKQYNASFIQIDSVCGHLSPTHDAEYEKELAETRRKYDCVLLGGVRFKYQAVRSGRSVEEDLQIAMHRCDAIVCTGEGTGLATPMQKLLEFKDTVGEFPVVVGAGVTLDTAKETAMKSDGAIVGSWFKDNHEAHNAVREQHVTAFMSRWNYGKTLANPFLCPPISEKYPVIQRPWGGERATRLMLELCPDCFKTGRVLLKIEDGYLGFKGDAERWVDENCSGLSYVADFRRIKRGYVYIVMYINERCVKPEADFPYLISGRAAGEFDVSVYLLTGDSAEWNLKLMYFNSYCCK